MHLRHDPYAERGAPLGPTAEEAAATLKQAETVLHAARQQNLTDNASRDDFARKMYMGLKGGKKRRHNGEEVDGAVNVQLQQLLEEENSSSEEEFQEVVVDKPSSQKNDRKKKKTKKRKRSKHHERRRNSDSDSSSESDDNSSVSSSTSPIRSEDDRRRRKRNKKKTRKHPRHKHSSLDSDDEASDNSRRRRRRKQHKRSRKEPTKDRAVPKNLFIAAQQFEGSKKGYVFKNGHNGNGYYEDTGKHIFVKRNV